MSQSKKEAKRKVSTKKGELDIDELVREVNRCDKQYGIRLKHPDVWKDPKMYYNIMVDKADENLGCLIHVLNGIPASAYVSSDTEEEPLFKKPASPMRPLFTDQSILMWSDHVHSYDMDSLLFRCRFLSLVLLQLHGECYDIIETKASYKDFRHSIEEQKLVLLSHFMNDVYRFVNVMLHPDNPYGNIILRMHEYLSYTKKNLKHQKMKEMLNGHVINVRHGMKTEKFTARFLTDDLAIYNLLKIAYMLATNKRNVNQIPGFSHIEGATIDKNLVFLIEALGNAVVFSMKGKPRYSPMFQAFYEARPMVWSQFYGQEERTYPVQMGILALGYTKFVMNDEEIGRFIDRMMIRGL